MGNSKPMRISMQYFAESGSDTPPATDTNTNTTATDKGQSAENKGGAPSQSTSEGDKTGKTFTQKELDDIVKQRLERSKKDLPSKEDLQKFKEWQDSQKSDDEKKAEAIKKAEKETLDAIAEASQLKAKVACLTKGVRADAVEDVVALSNLLITDDVDINKAIDKVLEKYPAFKGEQAPPPKNGITTGIKTADSNLGGGTSTSNFLNIIKENQAKRN